MVSEGSATDGGEAKASSTDGSATMQRWLDSCEVDYEHNSRARRKVKQTLERIETALLGLGTPW